MQRRFNMEKLINVIHCVIAWIVLPPNSYFLILHKIKSFFENSVIESVILCYDEVILENGGTLLQYESVIVKEYHIKIQAYTRKIHCEDWS